MCVLSASSRYKFPVIEAATTAALEECMTKMKSKFKLAGERGVKIAQQQEDLIRKMLEGARREPKEGGEEGLKDYIVAADLLSFFDKFLSELAEELKFSGIHFSRRIFCCKIVTVISRSSLSNRP